MANFKEECNMTRIFFVSDVHGSEKCFRKFINAGKIYKADVLILGGDITGKMIVPIVKQGNEYHADFIGKKWILNNEKELESLEKKIRDSGYYPYLTDPNELEELEADKSKVDKLFSELMVEQVKRWIKIAEERLKNTGIKCYITPGNDDRFDADKAFTESDYVINPEGKVVKIDDHHEMISTGFSNKTPWNSPREVTEERLEEIIEEMVSRVENMKNCIFNFHCPPYDTIIDVAPLLDETLKPVVKGGQTVMVHVGSVSVRKAIEKYQPLLGLHGHIHESRGVAKIGRTLCLNPGSEYTEGILRGVIINLDKGKIKSYMFTSG